MSDKAPKSGDGQLVVVGLTGLAVRPPVLLPSSVTTERHQLVLDTAMDWQQMAGLAMLWEAGVAATIRGHGRAYALAGQMAAAGEQLSLAHGASVEVALWVQDRGPVVDPADEMAMRGMADAQSLFVISGAHALANIGVRALALHPELRTALIDAFRTRRATPTFAPFSNEPIDWVSLNPYSCKVMREVAEAADDTSIGELVAHITRFGSSPSWKALVQRRGEDFHRWRPQTHGLEGVPKASPWKISGEAARLDLGHPSYEDARGLADEVAAMATDAMLELAEVMRVLKASWLDASPHLGGPTFADRA